MLDASRPSPMMDRQELAQVFIRYVCEMELNEREIDFVMSNQPFNALEPEFLNQYVDIVRQNVCECVKQLNQAEDVGSDFFSLLWQIWQTKVMTSTLSRINLLSNEGKAYLRMIFATIVREFVGNEKIVKLIFKKTEAGLSCLQQLVSMGLSDECNVALASRLPVIIKQNICQNWANHYSKTTIDQIKKWSEHDLVPEIAQALKLHPSELPTDFILDLASNESAESRISELYTIVERENDEGSNELAQALGRCRYLREKVVHSYVAQCRRKSLNGASDTVDIILMYSKTIHAFSIVDPQGVLSERVSDPIRVTLKSRSDTSAKLAEGIFGDPNSPLAFLSQELYDQSTRSWLNLNSGSLLSENTSRSERSQSHMSTDMSDAPVKERNPNQQFREWQPDPIDTPVDFVRKQTQDRVNTLINLYDNKEVFVQQFVKLFGAELLRASFEDSNTIDHLQDSNRVSSQRFGESNMLKIAVMSHDVRNSHKIADMIHARSPEFRSISALVLSRLYWPSLPKTPQYALPARFQELVDGYAAQFRELPGYENLDSHWLPQKGRVSVTLSMKDRELTILVKPHEAVVISCFDSEPLSLSDLLQQTHLDEPFLLEAIQFWVDQHVSAPDGESYKVLETEAEVQEQQRQGNAHVATAGEATQATKAIKDPFEDMHIYWSYIVGMLTNLGGSPVDKIHSFLVMFVPSESPYVKTKQELENYLLAMVDEGKLKSEDTKFSLTGK